MFLSWTEEPGELQSRGLQRVSPDSGLLNQRRKRKHRAQGMNWGAFSRPRRIILTEVQEGAGWRGVLMNKTKRSAWQWTCLGVMTVLNQAGKVVIWGPVCVKWALTSPVGSWLWAWTLKGPVLGLVSALPACSALRWGSRVAGVASAGQPTPLLSGTPFCDSGVGEEELRAPFTPKSWMDFLIFHLYY